jgi:putative MATE family efflux protein
MESTAATTTPIPAAERRPSGARRPDEAKLRARSAMLHGPILSTLMRLALPTIGVLIAQTLVNVAETYYVAFLGSDALVGVALVFPVWMLMTMMAAGGVGSGVASSIARAAGAGRHDDADALVFHAVVIAVVFGLAFSVGVIAFGGSLFRALGGSGAALGAALVYARFVFLAALPIWIVNLLSAALRGVGNVRVPALVTLAGAVILIPLSPLFIFGLGPMRGFGVAGAGIAVTLYYCGAAIVMLRYMLSGRSGLRLSVVRLRGDLLRDVLRVGVLASINALLLNMTVLLVTAAVSRFGIDAIGGYGTASRLDYVLIPLLFGMGTAVLTMVGTNVGAGAFARARRIAWIGAGLSAAFAGALGLVAALAPALWIGLFTREPAIMETGSLYLRIVGPTYAANGLIFILGFAAQGSGRMAWPFAIAAFRLLVAAGGGWIVVSAFAAPPALLFAVVASAQIAAALIFVAADRSGSMWPASPVDRP